jgi:WD40 repeat protein
MKAGICCAFSPDGRLIATGHDQRTMIWETDTGALLHTLEGNTTLVAGCAFSPDGRTIITAGYDKALRMFDTANGQLLCTLVGHTLELTACAFSPDGQFLLSASYDNTLRLWNAAVNEISLSGENRDSCINSVAFSPNGGMIASTNVDGVRVCDSTSGATLHTLKRHATWDSASACSFSPDGRYIVSSHEKTLLIWDSTNGELLRTLKTNTEFPPVFAFSPEGHLLVPGTLDDAWGVSAEDGLWVLEFANRSPLFRLERPTAELWDCSYSPDGKWILTVHKDSTQRLWDAFTGKLIYTLGHTSIKCAFSPDGHSILLSTYWDTLLLGTVSGESLFTMEGGDPIISPDGNFITTNLGTTFQVWEESSGQRLRELEGHTYRPIACFYSPDGKFLLSASGDRTLRVWDPNTGKQVDCLVLPGRIKCMGLHPTAPQIVCGDEGGAVYRVEIIGLEYGAIIVTASEVKLRLEVRCPACQNKHPISQTQLGTELICPNAGCGLHLKINPFVIHMA